MMKENDGSPAHRVMVDYIRLVKLHRKYLDQRLRETGVYRSQHQILMCISEHPGASQRDLAAIYEASTATIAVSLKKLEKGGYIKKVMDEDDNRYNQICLTLKGEEVVKHSRRLFKEMEEAMFAGFTQEDYERVGGYFKRLYQNLLFLGEKPWDMGEEGSPLGRTEPSRTRDLIDGPGR